MPHIQGSAEIRDLLHDLTARHGVTVLLSSHILTEVGRLATRTGIIHNGQSIREIPAQDLTILARPRPNPRCRAQRLFRAKVSYRR